MCRISISLRLGHYTSLLTSNHCLKSSCTNYLSYFFDKCIITHNNIRSLCNHKIREIRKQSVQDAFKQEMTIIMIHWVVN